MKQAVIKWALLESPNIKDDVALDGIFGRIFGVSYCLRNYIRGRIP